MNGAVAATLFEAACIIGLVLALAVPLSSYMVNAMEGRPTFASCLLEPTVRGCGKLLGIHGQNSMSWKRYLTSAIALTLLGILLLLAILLGQGLLPLNPQGFDGLPFALALNLAISFATNTNWQAVAPESTLSYFSQMMGLAVQNFLAPAIGLAVAFALMRAVTGSGDGKLGNFFLDVLRAILYVLLPLSLVLALVGVVQGTPQTFASYETVQLLEPVTVDEAGNVVDADDPAAVQEVTEGVMPLGPQASQVAIKQLGTNGGGFNSANSASALENPTPLTNLVQCASIMLLPLCLLLCFGRMANDRRQGRILLATVLLFLAVGTVVAVVAELQATPQLIADGAVYTGTDGQSAGNMEGKEVRIGTGASAIWAAFTTATSSGSANSSLAALTPLGLLVPLMFMGLGEVVGGGVGTGLAGLLGFSVLTVFIASLMIGRTPTFLGKKIGPSEMRAAVIIVIAPALAILFGAAILCLSPAGAVVLNEEGAAGFSKILYAATSAGANNGSALGGLQVNSLLVNIVTGAEMLFGRLVPLAATLVLAGNLASREPNANQQGALATTSPLFLVLLVVIILLIGALSMLPAVALGPLAQQFSELM